MTAEACHDVHPKFENRTRHKGGEENPVTEGPEEQDDLNIMTERACTKCGDLVLILSSRDWCDGCELEDPG